MATDLASELATRWSGPFHLRLLLQPCMALIFAIRDGRRDARSGATPYLQTILLQSDKRGATIASAWASVGKVMVIAFVLDCAFQLTTHRPFSLLEAAFMAALLCVVPYSLMRGPAARVFRPK